MRTDVVVTGLGAVTPLGADATSTWEALFAGCTGVRVLTEPAFADLPVRLAAPVRADPAAGLTRTMARRLDRYQQLAMTAAMEAWRDCGLADLAGTADAVPGDRIAVSIGSCVGGLTSMLDTWDTMQAKGSRHVSPFTIPRILPDGAASWVGLEIGARAAIHTPVAACATGNDAIRQGVETIRGGLADVVLAGAAEACIHPIILAGFASMRALSQRHDQPGSASRPFDEERDGFVLGEGAGMLVLESASHARRRGARIYAELAGTGSSADSHDFAQPDPTGAGQMAAMDRALRDAGLALPEINHISAHAASTPSGDAAEALSIRTVLGSHTDDVVIAAPKSAMGHLMGAAGAVESLLAVLTLHHRVVPPTANLDRMGEGIDLDVAREPRHLPGGALAALSNSFGLGGHNVIVALRSV
ncbi:MAG: fabF [Mycobacterium sp.]|nr:fabF [Mycobacterium sp.]